MATLLLTSHKTSTYFFTKQWTARDASGRYNRCSQTHTNHFEILSQKLKSGPLRTCTVRLHQLFDAIWYSDQQRGCGQNGHKGYAHHSTEKI